MTKTRFVSMKNTVFDLLHVVYLCKKPVAKIFREVQSRPEEMCVIVSDVQINDVPALPQYQNGALLKYYQ